jgi:hypothetical protein
MADLAAIRAGLAANLSTIPDLQVLPQMISNPTPPCVIVFAGPTEFDKAMGRGLDSIVFMVRILVPSPSDIDAVVNLDPYLAGSGAQSIKAAIETDTTLSGACGGLQVTRHEGEQVVVREGQPPALGAEFRVEINAHG